MKKKIAILGSTGSIGKTLLNIINKDKKNYKIILLTARTNYKKLLNQTSKFNVENVVIQNYSSFLKFKMLNKNKKINIYNDFKHLDTIFKKKIDYVMSSITGIDGLSPTLNIIKFTKTIVIANKESIICGWNLINKQLKKYNTKFIPVDSEHFSLWYGLRGNNIKDVEKVYLTASGGPFYNLPIKKFKNISVDKALKHPNWSMGKKISIDSATMINKIYEVIEAKNIFCLSYKQIEILTHPKSYIHAIIKFSNGVIKIIAHETTMEIPIFNTLMENNTNKFKTKKINIENLNNLNFNKINSKRYPMSKLLNLLPDNHSLYETIIVSANDTLVDLFLSKKIKFIDIQKKLFEVIKSKEFIKYRKIYPKNLHTILNLNNYVRLKILKKVYKSQNV